MMSKVGLTDTIANAADTNANATNAAEKTKPSCRLRTVLVCMIISLLVPWANSIDRLVFRNHFS